MRYVGQAYEINVALPSRKLGEPVDIAALNRAFHREHERVYGNAAEAEPVELVNLRATAIAEVPKAALKPLASSAAKPKPKGQRPVFFRRELGWQRCAVYERANLPPGWSGDGPLVIEEPGASVPVFPEHRVRVDSFGHLLIELPASDSPQSGGKGSPS